MGWGLSKGGDLCGTAKRMRIEGHNLYLIT